MTKFLIAKTPNPSHVRWSNFVPEGNINMSGHGDCSRAMDLSNHDFRAMIVFDGFGAVSLIGNAFRV